jgi:broad specificity phosphatase PhoE
MKLYLVRHGLTEENASRVIQGWNPGKLTAQGIEQAERLARRLREVRFDAIYSSDSRRAADTARIIGRFHDSPIQFTEALRERNMGVFQGGPAVEFEQAQVRSGLSPTEFTPEGGESLEELSDRATSFVHGLRRRHLHQIILLVAHGRWNSMLLAAASGMSFDDALTMRQTNTCVNILECDERGSFNIHLLNCAAHLSDGDSRSIATSSDNG